MLHQNFSKKLNIRFETLGCRLNQIESESAARSFLEAGFKVIIQPMQAKNSPDDETVLCVVNTCAVTQKAEQKDRRIIRLLLEKCPNAAVIVTGCYAQLSPEDIKKIDKRIAVLKGQLKSRLADVPSILEKELENKKFSPEKFADLLNNGLFSSEAEKAGTSENAFRLATDSFLAHSRSSIKIQDGCNCECSYCTIHIARGHSVSLDAEEVVRRVQKLESAGQSEVVITAVNIAQYKGKYKNEYIKFSRLLKLCLENTEKICFRISSLYPESVDPEFCTVAENPRVRPYFHISVQSGSDKILKLMKRTYTAEDVLNACNMLKNAKSNPFLSCDIITGFPGETDEDFEKTMDLCRKCGFAWVHVFPFSPRPGTVAAEMKPKIPQSTSGKRAAELSSWAKNSKIKYIESFRDKTVSAVLETIKKPFVFANGEGREIFHAVTENFLHCELSAPTGKIKIQPGSAIKVKILGPVGIGERKTGEIDSLADFLD